MSKSCVDCPSLLAGQAAADFWGVSLAEMGDLITCSRYGHVLGSAQGVRVELATKHADKCQSYGQQPPTSGPVNPKMGVWLPKAELLVKNDNLVTRPNSCLACVHFDAGHSACSAMGDVVLSTHFEIKAKSCQFGIEGASAGQVRSDKLPGWSGPSVAFVAVTGTNKKSSSSSGTSQATLKVVEPNQYDSDAKVTPEHVAVGIRAWRSVMSPKGREYFLPIFRTDYFTEEQQALIPSSSSDYGDPSLYIDHDDLEVEFAVQAYSKDMNLCLIGEPGSGKTEGARYLAWRMNMPFRRLAYHEASDPDQYLGTQAFGDHEITDPDDPSKKRIAHGTYLELGELPKDWITPGVLLSDEPNLAPEAIMQSYRSMNDASRELKVYGHTFKRHDYCFHMMAINPAWDFRNIGAKPMAAADSRRLSFHYMNAPTVEQQATILRRAAKKLDDFDVPNDLMKIITGIGTELRAMTQQNKLPDFWTTSQEVKVIRLVPDFGVEGAYKRAYFNYIDPDTANVAMEIVRNKIPANSPWV